LSWINEDCFRPLTLLAEEMLIAVRQFLGIEHAASSPLSFFIVVALAYSAEKTAHLLIPPGNLEKYPQSNSILKQFHNPSEFLKVYSLLYSDKT
jgi:hypothetical protein